MSNEHEQSAEVGGFLVALPPFEGIDHLELMALEEHSSTRILQAGESLFQRGDLTDSIYVIASGVLQLFGPSGAEVKDVQVRLVPGDVFGEAALRFYMPRSTTVVAVEASKVLCMPVQAVDSALQNKPLIRARITSEASWHLLRILLASTEMFCKLENSLSYYVASSSEFVAVKRGEVVMHEGDKPEFLYIVASGSLEVFRQFEDGSSKTIDILRDGACVGELAVLLNEPRSASVRAWRDSLLIKISSECIEKVLRSDAQTTFRLARTLGERLKRTTVSANRAIPVKTISVVPWCDGPFLPAFCSRLKQAFERAGHSVALLNLPAMSKEFGSDSHSRWLATQEAAHDYILCQCDSESPEWTHRTNQQADLVLFVGRIGQPCPGNRLRSEVDFARASGARAELVMLRDSAGAPQGTSDWLEASGCAAHHHVVLEDDGDYERLVRRVTGKAWGLVLGGGGARGLAHIGVIRAIHESGLPIDMIGGTSMGAIIAAQYAKERDPEKLLARIREAYVTRSGSMDLTIPFVSLRTARATIETLQEMFGSQRIEDLPISYFCVSCNLSRAEVVIHDRGPMWMWARVSCSVPGLLPPVPYKGDVLVDGGLLNNLPVDTMRKRLGGYVMASDVSVATDLAVSSALEAKASWSGIAQISRKFTRRPRLPTIFQILMRTAEIGSVRDSKLSGSPADLYLHPPVDDISMSDFHAIDRIVAIGYRYAARYLQESKPLPGANPTQVIY